MLPHAGDAGGDRDAGHAGAAAEHVGQDGGNTVLDSDIGQALALLERPHSEVGDAIGDHY